MTVDTLPTASLPASGNTEQLERISRLRQQMREAGLAAVALASPENIYYLLGLDHLGYFAFTLLVLPETGKPMLITRAMEAPTIRAQVPWCAHVAFAEGESPATVAAAVLSGVANTGDTVALDEDSMFFPPATAAGIRDRLPGLRWTSSSDLLSTQRAVKSHSEIECVREAARISDIGMATGIGVARPGVAERAVAAAVYQAMIAAGGQPPGFPPLIRGTDMLEQEHVGWSARAIRSGQALFFELSGSVHRYHAPQSRTVYIGQAKDGAAEAALAALAGLCAAREALRPGALTGQVYSAWQLAVAGGAAPAPPLRHHCGYLVGIGFPPSWVGGGEVLGIRPYGEVEIVPGMVFHLMSWVTRPVGHVISDTALVTSEGTELLTTTPRELTVIS
ncbi:MAG: M24 family metallopeptidase [Sciscionella sp.]